MRVGGSGLTQTTRVDSWPRVLTAQEPYLLHQASHHSHANHHRKYDTAPASPTSIWPCRHAPCTLHLFPPLTIDRGIYPRCRLCSTSTHVTLCLRVLYRAGSQLTFVAQKNVQRRLPDPAQGRLIQARLQTALCSLFLPTSELMR